MKVIMGVSRDGFVARHEADPMDWLGDTDKALFKLLTLSDMSPMAAGSRTASILPQLPGRTVTSVSRDLARGIPLEDFHAAHPHAWLIGGQTVVDAAIQADMVDQVFLCLSDRHVFSGVPISEELKHFGRVVSTLRVNDVTVEVRR